MDLSLPCPECKRKLKLPLSAAGQSVRCPMCAAVFTADADPEGGAAVRPPPSLPVPPVPLGGAAEPSGVPVNPPRPLNQAPPTVNRPVPPSPTRGPVSKPWAGRAGVSVVVLVVMGVLRLLFTSSRSTDLSPPKPIIIPTFSQRIDFPDLAAIQKAAKLKSWHPPEGSAAAFVRKDFGPPRRLVLDLQKTRITGMALSADEQTLAVGCESGVIYRIDPKTGFVTSVHDGDGKGTVVVALSAKGEYLAATRGGGNGFALFVPELDLVIPFIADGREDARRENFLAGAGALAFSPDGTRLATLEGGRVHLRDVPLGDNEQTSHFTARVLSFAFAPDGTALAVVLQDGTVRLWDYAGNKEKQLLQAGAPLRSAPVFSPDGNRLAACVGEDLKVWDLKAGKEWKTLRDARQPVGFRSGAFAPDGNTFAAWQDDGVIRLWDLTTGAVLADLEDGAKGGDVPPVLIFTKEGNTLIGAGGDRVTFWDVGKEGRARKAKAP